MSEIEEQAQRYRFGGLAHVSFENLPFDLGHGVQLSGTSANLFAPFLVDFNRFPNEPMKTPLMSTESSGFSFHVSAELVIPTDFDYPPDVSSDLGILWWITCLLRLRATTVLAMPLLSSESFSAPKNLPQTAKFKAYEIHYHRRVPERAPKTVVSSTDLEWVRDHWYDSIALAASSNPFNLLVLTLDAAALASPSDRGLELLALWGALESLFSPARTELRFRVSALIATYLEDYGSARRDLHREVMKLYDARSKLVHTSEDSDYTAVAETYSLARRVALRVIETKEIPNSTKLDQRLFGG